MSHTANPPNHSKIHRIAGGNSALSFSSSIIASCTSFALHHVPVANQESVLSVGTSVLALQGIRNTFGDSVKIPEI